MSIDLLLDYCRINSRVCPLPEHWAKLHRLLAAASEVNAMNALAAPLILNGWVYSNDNEKSTRLEEQLRWSALHGMLELADKFLRSLAEDDWHHSK